MQDTPNIVIFTPSFNRAHTLKRCYDSISEQDYPNLVWLIIDDGSTDNTREMVSNFIEEDKIKIHYIYQNNAGKQAAWNVAVKYSQKFDLFLGLDSDDKLIEGTLNNISDYFSMFLNEQDVIGLRCIAVRESTQRPDSLFSLDKISKKSWFTEISSRKIGERIDIYKPQLLINFLYPVNEKIKFIPEMWFYSSVAKEYKYLYLPVAVTIFYDQHNHCRLSQAGVKKNAEGQKIARLQFIKSAPFSVWVKNPVYMLKNLMRYVQCIYFINKKRMQNEV
ncbi:glycosyltransferase family A protein [Citrobacter portucalensis]|uniref:glycosyltransferase family A protein n=1 Tax=Citrobacter portucalensis TaxID=1639133 RepID=UPI003896CFEF